MLIVVKGVVQIIVLIPVIPMIAIWQTVFLVAVIAAVVIVIVAALVQQEASGDMIYRGINLGVLIPLGV
jgi:hypothetical protein